MREARSHGLVSAAASRVSGLTPRCGALPLSVLLSPMPDPRQPVTAGLKERLRELVAESEPGDRLPSERELSTAWGAARMSVGRAIAALAAEGVLERRQG